MNAVLYVTDLSPFGARLRLVAAFTGLSLQEMPPPGGAGSETMKAISHFGKMPAIETDGRVLIESIPLMEYLVEKAGGSTLMPETPEDRAAMRGIIQAHDHHALGAVWPMFLQLRAKTPDPAVAKAAMQAATQQYTVLTRLFEEKSDFAIGTAPTLADLAIAPFAVLFARVYPVFGETTPFEAVPRLARWWRTVGAVPEVERAAEIMNAGISRAFGPK
jgi:glutathione S-transferase/maleylpyruvate isomerase